MYRPLSHYLALAVVVTLALLFATAQLMSGIHTLFPTEEERQLTAVKTQIEIDRAQWQLAQEQAAHQQQPADGTPSISVNAPAGFWLLLGLTIPAALAAAVVYIAQRRLAPGRALTTRPLSKSGSRQPYIFEVPVPSDPVAPPDLLDRPAQPAISSAGPAFAVEPPIPQSVDPRESSNYERYQ